MREEVCSLLVRLDVTLYGESLDGYNYADAEGEIFQADVFIVGGYSLVVNPAAFLTDTSRGKHLIINNYLPTPYDGLTEYVIMDSIFDVFNRILQ